MNNFMSSELVSILRQRKILIGAAVGLVLLLIWLVAIFNPEGHKLAAVNSSVQSAQTEQTELQTRLDRLKHYSKESATFEALGAKLTAAVPATADVYDYITSISNAAGSTGVKVSSIDPSAPTAGGNVAVIPVTVSVTGNYSQTLAFVEALYALPRLTVINQISISGGGSGSNRGTVLTDQFNLDIFAAPSAVQSSTSTSG